MSKPSQPDSLRLQALKLAPREAPGGAEWVNRTRLELSPTIYSWSHSASCVRLEYYIEK